MDVINVEPDSDSDCRHMSSLNDDCLDGVKDEQQNVPEVANDAKEESWNVDEFLEVEVTTEEHEVRRKRMAEQLDISLVERQQCAIEFCVRLGKSGTETLQLIHQAYGDDAMRRAAVLKWWKRFRAGETNVVAPPS